MKSFIIFFTALFFVLQAFAQEKLPDFSVYKVGGRVVIAWTHDYPVVKQINVQRSVDSINYFKTIASPPDPSLQENGVSDATPLHDSMFYRIFIQFDNGRYTVTKSKRPAVDSLGLADAYKSTTTSEIEEKINFLPENFTASRYIFTGADRYVRFELPFDNKKYTVKFFNQFLQPLFELKDLKERRFKLDRSYFQTAGYVNFELYADDKLIEKYKLFIPKEF